MTKLEKYTKVVLLSTLAERKTLVDMSTTWFNNKGRLYQPIIIKEIKKAVTSDLLKQKDKKLKKCYEEAYK